MPTKEEMERRANAAPGRLNETDGIQCPVCGNKGAVYRLDEAGCLYAAECECMARRRSLRLLRRSGLEGLVKESSFNNFQTPDTFTRRAREAALNYIKQSEGGWFFISGRPGCGKTHLCTAICRRFLLQNVPVRYLLWREDGPRLKAMVNNDPAGYAAEMEELCNVPVLYIDDFLKGKVTDADLNLAFALINARYNRRRSRTLISSQRSLEKIWALDEATGSRISQRAEGFILCAPAGAINWRCRTAAGKEKR